MLRSCYRPLERCLGLRFGAGGGGDGLWHMDLKPHASGDYSIAVVQANSNLEDQGQVFTSPSATYVGVYDGHGGPEASRFVNSHLFPYLHKFATEQGGLSPDVIKKAFSATEEDFLRLVKRSLPMMPQIASVGSCCLLGAISNDVLYVANLGDSRAVLGRRVSDSKRSPVVAERLSTDHNVGVEEVRKEVEALHPDDSHVVVFTRGVWRIKGIIQVQWDSSNEANCVCCCLKYEFVSSELRFSNLGVSLVALEKFVNLKHCFPSLVNETCSTCSLCS
ncbi:unnamed protein product [Malus baccata var. baccata]